MDLSSMRTTPTLPLKPTNPKFYKRNRLEIMHLLKSDGVVVATRGKQGGFQLASESSEISLQMIFDSLKDNEAKYANYCDKHCSLNGECFHIKECSLRPVWSFTEDLLKNVFSSISLLDMLRSEKDSKKFIKDLTSKLVTNL